MPSALTRAKRGQRIDSRLLHNVHARRAMHDRIDAVEHATPSRFSFEIAGEHHVHLARPVGRKKLPRGGAYVPAIRCGAAYDGAADEAGGAGDQNAARTCSRGPGQKLLAAGQELASDERADRGPKAMVLERAPDLEVLPDDVAHASIRRASGPHVNEDLGDVKRIDPMHLEEAHHQLHVGCDPVSQVEAAESLVNPSAHVQCRMGRAPSVLK